MATQDVQISDLTQVNTPATTDLLLIRHGTVDSKITYSDIKSAINTNTLYASSDGVVTDQANQYYNRSQVDAKVTNLQNQIDTLNSKTSLTAANLIKYNDNVPISINQNECLAVRRSGVVQLIIRFTTTSVIAGETAILLVPSGYRPYRINRIHISQWAKTPSNEFITVYENGDIKASTGLADNTQYIFTIAYIAS